MNPVPLTFLSLNASCRTRSRKGLLLRLYPLQVAGSQPSLKGSSVPQPTAPHLDATARVPSQSTHPPTPQSPRLSVVISARKARYGRGELGTREPGAKVSAICQRGRSCACTQARRRVYGEEVNIHV